MEKLNAIYESPCLEVIEVQTEQCVLSGSYGGPGEAGQGSGYNDLGDI